MFKHPARTVTENVLHSTALPDIRIRIDSAFEYAGHVEINLGNTAAADMHFFVDADPQSKRLKRMIKFQFESFLPDAAGAYNYPLPDSTQLGQQMYLYNLGALSEIDIAREKPDGDIAQGRDFLLEQDYGEWDELVFMRFVRLLDAEKRNEFIVVYSENLAESAYTLKDLYTKSETEIESITGELFERACKSFTVIDG